jgi:hypothetical protein
MKRLVLCFDGTWNAIADPKVVTNVVRLANLITVSDDKGVGQITYYNSGVGSGGPIDRFIGGAFGAGLKANVKRGLTFLALNYDQGDEIYLFGFSRGAYTARALGGVIGAAGIPLDISETERHWIYYQQIAKLKDKAGRYHRDSPKRKSFYDQITALEDELSRVSRYQGKDVPIACIGVWDTVGAYGIPSGFGLGALPRIATYWTRGFRDTRIGATVKVGLHAVAIDEMRRPFVPTFWTLRDDRTLEDDSQDVEQVWFPGVHSNIGGGYDNAGLSDLALAWMVAMVQKKTDLKFNETEVLNTIWPCSAATLYRSSNGGVFTSTRDILPGSFPLVASRIRGGWRRLLGKEAGVMIHRINEAVHWSVRERSSWKNTLVDGLGPRSYAPANLKSIAKVIDPSPLEESLLSRDRDWKGKCPLEAAGLVCECQTRVAAGKPGPSASVAA